MTTTTDKEFFTQEELIKRWGITEDEFKNLKQKLIPIRNDMLDRYPCDYILKFESWYYLTKEQLVKRWGGREDLVNKANIKSKKIDEKDCYKIFDVLNSEYSFLLTQKQLAKRWETSFDYVKKINNFVTPITIDGEVYYPSSSIIEYEKCPILLIDEYEQSPDFMFKKYEEDLPI